MVTQRTSWKERGRQAYYSGEAGPPVGDYGSPERKIWQKWSRGYGAAGQELALLAWLEVAGEYSDVAHLLSEGGVEAPMARALLRRWVRLRWYASGTSLEHGQLTVRGRHAFRQLLHS